MDQVEAPNHVSIASPANMHSLINPNKILIASGNAGKVRELAAMFHVVPVVFCGLDEIAAVPEVEESGPTFEENARLKAAGYALRTRMWSLADDSGLEVTALGGRPGVHSARYGGQLPYSEKIKLLLGEMERSGSEDRSARFVCSMALSDPDGSIAFAAAGECRGSIALAPAGENGFGYDPIFVPEGYDTTFAQLPDEVKKLISHRARAASKIIRYLLDFTGIPA
jgi:XTP/dITP diphosphohydrolase